MRKVNLIPMAGDGQRFIDKGYNTPKPLIDINGLPMIVRAAKSLPKADQWIFVCRGNHIEESNIEKILENYFPGSLVIEVDHLTEGQASTCLLSKEYLFPDDQLTIGACDNGMLYNSKEFSKLINKYDAVIWTFRNNPAVMQNPKMYGWVKINELGIASEISCKIPISTKPLNDHAVIGSFSFKKAETFLKCAEKMIEKNRRVNNEFYLDVVMDECILNGHTVMPFEVNEYTCWGTPKDLENFLK